MTSLEIYLLTLLDSLNEATTGLLIFSLLTIPISIFIYVAALNTVYSSEEEEFKEKYLKIRDKVVKASVITSIISLLMCTFVPTTKQMAAIIFIPQMYNAITENKELQKLPANVIGLANQWIEELAPKREK